MYCIFIVYLGQVQNGGLAKPICASVEGFQSLIGLPFAVDIPDRLVQGHIPKRQAEIVDFPFNTSLTKAI